MSSYDDSELMVAFLDLLCVKCGGHIPRHGKCLAYAVEGKDLFGMATVVAEIWCLVCAKTENLKARCLEPRAPRCQPMED